MPSPTVIRVLRQGPTGIPYAEETLTPGANVAVDVVNYTHGAVNTGALTAVNFQMPTFATVPSLSVSPKRYLITVCSDDLSLLTLSFENSAPTSISPVYSGNWLTIQCDWTPLAAHWNISVLSDQGSVPVARNSQTMTLSGSDNYANVNIDFSRYKYIWLQPGNSTLGGDNIIKLNITPDPYSGTGILRYDPDTIGPTNLIFQTSSMHNDFQNMIGNVIDITGSGALEPWSSNGLLIRFTFAGADNYTVEFLQVV